MKIQFPTISAVIPLYNKEGCIERALESIFRQSLKVNQIIVIDDGSTDNGGAVCQRYLDRINYLKIPNAGVSHARNLGVTLSTSEYVAFLDADDEWYPDHIQTILELIIETPSAAAYATSYLFCYKGEIYKKAKIVKSDRFLDNGILCNYFEMAAKGNNPLWTSAVCIKKEDFQALGGFPEGVVMKEDLYLWAKIALNKSIAFSSKETVAYHKDAENSVCTNHVPSRKDTEFQFLINDAIDNKRLLGMEAFWARRYINKHVLLNVFKAVLRGGAKEARLILRDFRVDTRWDSVICFIYTVLSYVPNPVLKVIWRVVRAIKFNWR